MRERRLGEEADPGEGGAGEVVPVGGIGSLEPASSRGSGRCRRDTGGVVVRSAFGEECAAIGCSTGSDANAGAVPPHLRGADGIRGDNNACRRAGVMRGLVVAVGDVAAATTTPAASRKGVERERDEVVT